MALEQMRAFMAGVPQDQLGSTRMLEPDNYPLLETSELKQHHQTISDLLASVGQTYSGADIHGNHVLQAMCSTDSTERTFYAMALIERIFAYDAKLSPREIHTYSGFFDYGPAAEAISLLFDKGVEHETLVPCLFQWFTAYRFNYYGTIAIERAVHWLIERYSNASLPEKYRNYLIKLRGQFEDIDYTPTLTFLAIDRKTDILKYPGDQWLEPYIDQLIGTGPWLLLVPCEVWTKNALASLANLSKNEAEEWRKLIDHCGTAIAATPTPKWVKTATSLLKAIGENKFVTNVIQWFADVPKGRIDPTLCMSWENVDEQQRMHKKNATILKGLLWISSQIQDPHLIRAVAALGANCYKKIRGLGPRAVKVGNAVVYALSRMGLLEAVGQLSILQAKVKFGTAQKQIEKAFVLAAEQLGLPRNEIEEMAVPTYGLTEPGKGEELFGEFTAHLEVKGTSKTEVKWIKPDGKSQTGIPSQVKETLKEDLKEFQASAKDLLRMLTAQKERLDSVFLQQKSWKYPVWQERYLNHPLIGILARTLLWDFKIEGRVVTGIWFRGSIVDVDLKPIENLTDTTEVELWHPISKPVEEILGWRTWLDTQQIQQPFKQAHREFYLLTEAEQRTNTYSNRYAAHVLKQHQFSSLCASKGWKNQLRLMVDSEYPPATLYLPKWGLRAEFWIEGIGNEYGNATNESGAYLYVSTDQVRFYRIDSAQRQAHAGGGGYYTPRTNGSDTPLPLSQVPPLVFSEVMRDVDMFVGVASVGNDPAWSDGGADGRYRDYWAEYSFGALNASAKTRKEVLERLIPKLKIGSKCSFNDKFLIVKGTLRSYKIHLGSGNILMEPNDQYLCIVPKQTVNGEHKVFLPFEGDRTLSIVISKAFLLADDAKITDPSIISQIKNKV